MNQDELKQVLFVMKSMAKLISTLDTTALEVIERVAEQYDEAVELLEAAIENYGQPIEF